MHSSISNSNDRLPYFNWRKIYITITLFVIAFLLAWNTVWISVGFTLEPKDNPELWSYHRRKASMAGKQAIVFTGSSRIKAGIDLDEVERQTGKTPFQLAMGGRSPVPILKHLAEDESFEGDVVAEITEHILYSQIDDDRLSWISEYEKRRPDEDFIFPIKSFAQSLIVSPNLGNTTSEVLNNICTGKVFDKNFLDHIVAFRQPTTKFNRSSQGYADNALEEHIEKRRQFSLDSMKKLVSKSPPDKDRFKHLVQEIEDYTKRIQARGGRVILVNFPFNGEIKELNEKYFPKRDFWDVLSSLSSAQTIYYADYPTLAAIETLDGTHFSGQNATLFTQELFKIIESQSR